MHTDDLLPMIKHMIAQSHQLAADRQVLARVAGERIATILADLLYEIDPDRDEVISLLPPQRRD